MFHPERLREIAVQPSFEELEKSRKRAEEREKYASVEEYAQSKLAEYKNNKNYMNKNNTTLFQKIWKYGKRGCTQRERYIDLPDGINVTEDCICAQICAFKDTNEVMVYVLHCPDDEVDNWGEFMYLHELPMNCLKAIIAVFDNLEDIEVMAELKRKLAEDDD